MATGEGGRNEGDEGLELGLATVFVLSALAGAVDACGLTILKDLFVSFMSGDSTSLAVAIGQGDRGKALLIAPIVATFVAGAAAGTVLAVQTGRRHLPAVVAFVAAILVVPIVWPPATILAMTFAMGALNAAMNHAGDVAVSITYIPAPWPSSEPGLAVSSAGRRRTGAGSSRPCPGSASSAAASARPWRSPVSAARRSTRCPPSRSSSPPARGSRFRWKRLVEPRPGGGAARPGRDVQWNH